MKKIWIYLMVLVAVMTVLSGCSSNNSQQEASKLADFTEENGLLVYTDLENSPFENSGLKISIEKGQEGSVKFVKTDTEGNETVDYFIFDFKNKQMEKYYYVSAMGTGYFYYFDLASKELVRVEDADHNDVTESLKSVGRWENAALNTEMDVETLEEYFKGHFDISIEEAVL